MHRAAPIGAARKGFLVALARPAPEEAVMVDEAPPQRSDEDPQRGSVAVPGRSPVQVSDFRKPGVLLAMIVALWLAMHEISALSAGFVTQGGKVSSFNSLSGPGVWSQRDWWNDPFTQDQLG